MVILLTWIYLSAFMVLLGAVINAQSEQQTRKDSTAGPPQALGQRDAHLASLADIAELLRQLQQPDLGANDLLFLGHLEPPFRRWARAVPAVGENRTRPPAPLPKTNNV